METELTKVVQFNAANPVAYVKGIDIYNQTRGQHLSIGKLRKEHGDKAMVTSVLYLVGHLSQMINVGKGLTTYQVVEIAESIMQECKTLSLYDIKKCFQKAMTGKYGKVFDRLDMMIIHEFINAEREHLLIEAERESIVKHHNEKHEKYQMPEEARERLKQIAARLSATMNDLKPLPYNYHKGINSLLHAAKLSHNDINDIIKALYVPDPMITYEMFVEYCHNRAVVYHNTYRINPTMETITQIIRR